MQGTDPKRTTADRPGRRGEFRLLRYFTLTSFIALAIAGLALFLLERMEIAFFQKVQREQQAFFAKVQADLAREQEEAARRSLLAVHEAGHVNLAKVFSNMLWRSDLAAFVDRVQAMPVDECRAAAAEAREACFAQLRARIMALPGFAALDAKMRATARDSTVFKVKVYDLRGITAYSSEHAQIGEDKADNDGWKRAARGTPASELAHRDQFSAFERVVVNRDLISSYIPGRAPGSDAVAGVFEIYSDATPFVAQIRGVAARQAALAAENQATVERAAEMNEDRVHSNAYAVLAVVGALLALLYLALYLVARRGQRILDRQAREREQSIRREQQWHREKMDALAAMAANVSHEVGTPLSTINLLARDMAQAKGSAPGDEPRVILEEAERIARMTREISRFAAARSESPELLDVNAAVKAMCEFLSYDRRARATRIDFQPGAQLPACSAVPDHLNEALMGLMQMCAQDDPEQPAATPRVLRVRTEARGAGVAIRIGLEPAAALHAKPIAGEDGELRFEAALRRVQGMGGRLEWRDGTIEVILPPAPGA